MEEIEDARGVVMRYATAEDDSSVSFRKILVVFIHHKDCVVRVDSRVIMDEDTSFVLEETRMHRAKAGG